MVTRAVGSRSVGCGRKYEKSLWLARVGLSSVSSVRPWSSLTCVSKVDLRIGICIGVNAALISIVTEWLSDLKMGYCYDGWWLNQQFCCWEIDTEGEACDSWHDWSDFTAVRWMVYVIVAVRFVSLDQKQSRSD